MSYNIQINKAIDHIKYMMPESIRAMQDSAWCDLQWGYSAGYKTAEQEWGETYPGYSSATEIVNDWLDDNFNFPLLWDANLEYLTNENEFEDHLQHLRDLAEEEGDMNFPIESFYEDMFLIEKRVVENKLGLLG